MNYLFSILIGYALGMINPSYILGRIKRVDMRKSGTGNLGASNTFINLGPFWGIFVMLFDILKGFLAVRLAAYLFPMTAYAGLVAGACAVLGHNYPFYLRFRGGKGLASFAGLILGVSPLLFVILLALTTVIAFILNYGCTVSFSSTLLFPIMAGIYYRSIIPALIALVCSANVFYRHTENIGRIRRGEETKLTDFIKKYVFKFKKK